MNHTQIRTAASADPAQVATAKAFLLTLTPMRTITRQSSYSYVLKHVAEDWGGLNGMQPYVSNDALIAAAIELDLPVRWVGDRSSHAYIGVTRASCNRAHAKVQPGYVDPAVLRERPAAAKERLAAFHRARRSGQPGATTPATLAFSGPRQGW